MRKQSAIGAFLMLLVFSVLTTCQLQLNQSKGLALHVIVPKSISSGARSVVATNAASAKDVAGPSGASVQVTIQTQAGAPWANSEPIATGGKTSVNFTVPMPPPGAYQASAQLMDASGNLLSQAGPTSFAVPTQTNPVVLTMPSNLYTMVVTDSMGVQYPTNPPFTPVAYGPYSTSSYLFPIYLTVTAVDPSASIVVIQNGTVISPAAGLYTIPATNYPVSIVVTSADGTTSSTYTYQPNEG